MIVVQIVVNRVNQSQVHKLYTSSRKRAQIDCSTVTLYILLLFQIHQFPSCVMSFRSCMQFSLAFTFEQRTFKKNLLLLDRVLSLVKNKSQKKLTHKTLSSLFLSASKSRRRRLLLILLLLCRVVAVVLPPFSHV